MLYTIIDAVKLLGKDGDIKMVLARYQKQMIMCDVGPSERVHRDLVYFTILENPALEAYAEYQVAKVSNTLGPAYPLIEVGSGLHIRPHRPRCSFTHAIHHHRVEEHRYQPPRTPWNRDG